MRLIFRSTLLHKEIFPFAHLSIIDPALNYRHASRWLHIINMNTIPCFVPFVLVLVSLSLSLQLHLVNHQELGFSALQKFNSSGTGIFSTPKIHLSRNFDFNKTHSVKKWSRLLDMFWSSLNLFEDYQLVHLTSVFFVFIFF